ncbi:MAG TPA: hypothetical protein VHT97_00225 [Acidimicrobiales bacterium]|nr:hypothetical protein [Acidimicrobiales bacterium]
MQVHLTNTGPDPCEVAVELPPADRDWSWVHPESCAVAPGQEAVVAVFFKPACGSHPTAGTHTVEIVARASGDGAASASGQGTVEVGPWIEAAGVLDPLVAHDLVSHSYTLNFENRGNVPVRASFKTEDPSGGGIQLDLQPSELVADPGQTATATLTAQARKKLKRGEQRYRICVLATIEGAPDLRIEGAFYQQGVKSAR